MFLSILSIFNLKAQPRLIYWLHGLGGDESAWSKAATATTNGVPALNYPARNVIPSLPEYVNTNYDLAGAAISLVAKFDDDANAAVFSNNSDRSKIFIIAHSQGGLVARQLEKYYYEHPNVVKNVNGIVTFGTPHYGARIINNIPNFNNFIDTACTQLLLGPIEEAIPDNFLISLIVTDTKVKKVLDTLCSVLSVIAPFAFTQFTAPITQDFAVGAFALNDLNNFELSRSSSIPKVAFYGIEDPQTAVWRVLYNVLKKKPNAFPAFMADADSELLDTVNVNIAKYQAKATQAQNDYYNMASNYCSWWDWVFAPNYCAFNDAQVNTFRNKALARRDAWQNGVDWWNSAGDRFNLLTGAKSFQPVTTTTNTYNCNCVIVDYNGNVISQWSQQTTNLADCAGSGGNGTFKSCSSSVINSTTSTTYLEVNKPSDGIVLQESAMNYPGISLQNTAVMQGSNHQQMRNDSNTQKRLDFLRK